MSYLKRRLSFGKMVYQTLTFKQRQMLIGAAQRVFYQYCDGDVARVKAFLFAVFMRHTLASSPLVCCFAWLLNDMTVDPNFDRDMELVDLVHGSGSVALCC